MYITLYAYIYEKIEKRAGNFGAENFDDNFSVVSEVDDRDLNIRIPNFTGM